MQNYTLGALFLAENGLLLRHRFCMLACTIDFMVEPLSVSS